MCWQGAPNQVFQQAPNVQFLLSNLPDEGFYLSRSYSPDASERVSLELRCLLGAEQQKSPAIVGAIGRAEKQVKQCSITIYLYLSSMINQIIQETSLFP
jgi:hypothetical protein